MQNGSIIYNKRQCSPLSLTVTGNELYNTYTYNVLFEDFYANI